jgi:hypothetical protein
VGPDSGAPFRTCALKPDAVTPVPSPPKPPLFRIRAAAHHFCAPPPQKSFAHAVAADALPSSSLPLLLLHSFEPAMAASKPLRLRLAVPLALALLLALALVTNFLWASSSRRVSPLSAPSSSRTVSTPHCPGIDQRDVLNKFRRSI